MAFSTATKLQLLFDLNCFEFRTETGAWDSSNAAEVFRRITSKSQADAIYGFELGNEVWGVWIVGWGVFGWRCRLLDTTLMLIIPHADNTPAACPLCGSEPGRPYRGAAGSRLCSPQATAG